MNAFPTGSGGEGRPRWSLVLALVATLGSAASPAQVVTVPAAHLNHAEGTVAWSPQGDTEWHDVQPRRVLKRGDRLWTDGGSRAEVQAGGHALRLDSRTQLVLENVSENATQLSLTQGSVVLTVTRVSPGDSIELGTPNLAFRARQPGDYRIDVDTKAATTRVVVLSGAGVVYGEKGEAQELRSGQRASFRERSLGPVRQAAFTANDDFDRWAGARRRGEPTVSMPMVAQAAPAAPYTGLVNSGRDIIISGPASSLPGARKPVTGPVAAAGPMAAASPPFQVKGPPVAVPPVARAQSIPNFAVTPASPAAAPLRVTTQALPTAPVSAPATAAQAHAQAQPQAAIQARAAAQASAPTAAQTEARAQAEAKAQARAQARAQAKATRAQQQERERIALQQTREEERRASARRAEEERKAAIAKRSEDERKGAAAKRAEDQRRVVAARRAQEERRHAQEARRATEEATRLAAAARREQEHKRLQARRAEDKRLAVQRKEEEKRLAAARAVEAQKLAEARKRHLARLQEQAGRDEATVREALFRREQQSRRVDQERREEQARQEELARREESDRRQRLLADQWRRDQERREQEVWLRQQQPLQPVRPTPMGVPFRRVS